MLLVIDLVGAYTTSEYDQLLIDSDGEDYDMALECHWEGSCTIA